MQRQRESSCLMRHVDSRVLAIPHNVSARALAARKDPWRRRHHSRIHQNLRSICLSALDCILQHCRYRSCHTRAPNACLPQSVKTSMSQQKEQVR